MVLSVDSSSKTLFFFTAVIGFAIFTALFFRTRKNELAYATSLDKERVSTDGFPSIDWIGNLFTPQKTSLTIGNPSKPLPTLDKLVHALTDTRKHHQSCDTLVIHTSKFEIWKDPGILLLKPKKLILDGACINTNRASGFADSLMKAGWSTENGNLAIVDVNSVEEAINAAPANPTKPQPTVYSVKHF